MVQRAASSVRGGSWRWHPPAERRRAPRFGALSLACPLLLACAGQHPAAKTPGTPSAGLGAAKAPVRPEVGAPVTLLPAATARPLEFSAISIGSFDHLLASGVKLVGEAFPLPMTAESLRDTLLQQAGLPPEVGAELDLASPSGAAIVALDDKGGSGLVLAIPARGPAEAEKLIDALGKRMMTRGPVTLVQSTGKTQGWVFRAGNVVVLSDQLDALTRGAMLALEARRVGPDDVTATIYPDAIAHAHGTDLKTAIAALLDEVRAMQAARTGSTVSDRATFEIMAKLFGLVGDADHVEAGLTVDLSRGLVVRARLVARPGTALASIAREVRPFEIDPLALESDGRRFLVGAASLGPFWHELLDHYRQRLADDKAKGAAAALAYYQAFLSSMLGLQSGSMWLRKEPPYFAGVFVAPLKDAAAAAKVGAALGRMDTDAMSALLRAQLGPEVKQQFSWTAKRESAGKARAAHVRLTLKKGAALDLEAFRRIFGDGIDVYQAVVGTRVIGTLGRDARAELAKLAAGSGKPKKLAPDAALDDARAAAKGRDAFYYFDFAPVLGLAGAFTSDPRVSALARLGTGPIPLVVTAGGDGAGQVWSADLTLPVAAFKSVGGLIAAGAGAFK